MTKESILNYFEAAEFSIGPEGAIRFGASMAPAIDTMELQELGCHFISVDPGKRTFPIHNHLGNDELSVVLEGEET